MTSAMMAVKQVMMVTMCHYPYRTLPVRLPKVSMSKENCIIPSEYWSVGFLWQASGCITRGGHAHTAYTALGNIHPVYTAYILLQAIYTQYILRIYIYCSRQYISNISWFYYILERKLSFLHFPANLSLAHYNSRPIFGRPPITCPQILTAVLKTRKKTGKNKIIIDTHDKHQARQRPNLTTQRRNKK